MACDATRNHRLGRVKAVWFAPKALTLLEHSTALLCEA
jgi:hypothetical protein